MHRGFVKLYRSIDEWEWRTDPNTLSVWLYMLTHARHEPGSWRGVELQPGQLITGRDALSKATGVSVRGVRTALEHLEKSGNLTIKATNKFSVVTIEKWDFWQGGTQTTDQQPTSNRPATDQQPTTNKNVKNEKNERMKESAVVSGGEGWKDLLEYYGFLSAGSDIDQVKELSSSYSEEWVKEALRRTAQQQSRNWSYVQKILKDWQNRGCMDSPNRQQAEDEKAASKFQWLQEEREWN